MDFTNPLFLIPGATGPFIILAGVIMLKFPPKNINGVYGYRTRSSMKSQERWDFSQRHSAKEMIKWGVIMTLVSLLGLVLKTSEAVGVVVGIVITLFCTVILIMQTERALKVKFGSVE